MKNVEKLLDRLNIESPFPLLYEFGATPDSIKDAIVESFLPFFRNPGNLKEHAIDFLVEIWVVYLKACRDHKNTPKHLTSLLNLFNEAFDIGSALVFDAYRAWIPDISHSVSKYWSLVNKSLHLSELSLEDFVEESFGIIGTTIEGLGKPYIRLLFQLNRIRLEKNYTLDEIISKDIGFLLDEINNSTNLTDLLISENGIRLNQWRNIAYHHKFIVVGEKIKCTLERRGGDLKFELSRDDLYNITKDIMLVHKILQISAIVWRVDNFNDFNSILNSYEENDLSHRQEESLTHFYSGFASQGFLIKNITHNNDVTILKIKDLRVYDNFLKRSIHSSQFMYNLWFNYPAKRLIIEYYLYNDQLFFTSSIEADYIKEAIESGSYLSEIIKKIKFDPVFGFKFEQNANPFDGFAIDKNKIDCSILYLSQTGEQVTVEDFVKQIVLTVLTNYVVLVSERISVEKIKVSVGADGSTVYTDMEGSDPVTLVTPAFIDDKYVSEIISAKLFETINLFNQNILDPLLVESALNSNRYIEKKSFVKDRLMRKYDNN